jgi:hypothetical protein
VESSRCPEQDRIPGNGFEGGVHRTDTFRLEGSGEVDWWFRPPWHRDKDRPSVLDAERLMRRHAAEIRRLLSEWLGDEGETEEAVA